MVTDLWNYSDDLDDALYGEMSDPTEGKGDYETFKWYMDHEMLYRNNNLKLAIKSKNEIMIRSETYYGINLTEFFARDDYQDDSKGDAKAINTAIKLIQDLL
jgi:hypothetical protein